MTQRAVRYLVSGRVQGVFFRASTRDTAQHLGLSGWVRNLPDGRVEVLAVGDDSALAALAAWLWKGPPSARVEAIVVEEVGAGESRAEDGGDPSRAGGSRADDDGRSHGGRPTFEVR